MHTPTPTHTHPTPHTLRHTFYTLHPYTLHPTPYALRPTPYTLGFEVDLLLELRLRGVRGALEEPVLRFRVQGLHAERNGNILKILSCAT